MPRIPGGGDAGGASKTPAPQGSFATKSGISHELGCRCSTPIVCKILWLSGSREDGPVRVAVRKTPSVRSIRCRPSFAARRTTACHREGELSARWMSKAAVDYHDRRRLWILLKGEVHHIEIGPATASHTVIELRPSVAFTTRGARHTLAECAACRRLRSFFGSC